MVNAQIPASSSNSLQLQDGIPARAIPRKIYVGGLLLSLPMWATLPSLFVPHEILQTYLNQFGCGWVSADALPMIFMIAAIFYLIEGLVSPVFAYLRHQKMAEDIVSYIQRLRSYPPLVQFSCQCYHTELRTRYVTETTTDANGNTQTTQRAETYTETVVTYSEQQPFHFSRWQECSADLKETIFEYQYTCIDFAVDHEFGDSATEERYNREKQYFIERNKNRDSGFSFSETCTLQDFTPKMLSVVDATKRSPFLHWFAYICATLLLLSWPYRRWFDRHTVYGHYRFRKRLSA